MARIEGTPALSGPGVCDLVRAQARTDDGRAALIDLTGTSAAPVSYGALIERADAMAARLRALGTGPERPVAVLLERSADVIVAMLAVLAAGGAYCPLDVTAPGARIDAIAAALGAHIAVADEKNARKLPGGTIVVDPAEGTGSGEVGLEAPAVRADALAYVMHTSGSTGQPKGVAMSHHGLTRLIRWQVASGLPALRTLQFTATSFDVTFQETLSTLATGGCLVIASEDIRRDPGALLDAITSQRIQRLFLPYVALQLLAVEARRRSVVPSSLEHIVTAGEKLVITPAIRELFAGLPHCRLDNHYGPTEAHLVTSLTLPAGQAAWPLAPSIGMPVDGVGCWVLDDSLRPVPPGEPGELYVSGSGLARGYFGAPALTAERFVASPSGRAGERLYRTGDLVRLPAGGMYEFLGRADGQLKVRGFRVEPAEVENALSSHPRVDAAAVALREVADGVPVLVAYLQTNGYVPHREISEHARGLLPAYMVPSRYLSVSAMPRTPNGKIDACALAELALPEVAGAGPSPSGPSAAAVITAIWTRVLGHDEFDETDDFFDVGGDSLLATWVVTELRQALGAPVDLSAFLESSTVEDLARTLALSPVPGASPPGRRPRSSQVVTLRPGPSGRSLYLMHPLGGELICYRQLTRASRAPARLLGVAWAGDPPEAGSSLAQIASAHVEQLRVIQPDGPYMLAGWSFGGVLAYEMAQQLTAAGRGVSFLGLLDANPVIDPITGLPIAQTPFLKLLDDVLRRLDDPAAAAGEVAELTASQAWIQLMGAPIAPGAPIAYLRNVLATARACMEAVARYQPEPYAGPTVLFQAADAGTTHQAKLAAAIRGLCTGLCDVIPIPGDHWGFTRSEYVRGTAAQLDAALERAGTAGSASHGS